MTRPLASALPLALIASFAIDQASAQSKSELSSVRFYPAVGPGNFVTVDGASVGTHLTPSFGVSFDYAGDTLVIERPCSGIDNVAPSCRNEETSFVKGTGLVHLMTSLSFAERAQVSLDLPFGFSASEPFDTRLAVSGVSPALRVQPAQGFALADARVAAKVLIAGKPDEALRFSASLFSTLPTAMLTSAGDCRDEQACHFLGERGAQVGGYFISEFAVPEFRVAANVGAAYRPSRTFLTAETQTELIYGLAGQYRVTPLFNAMVELSGAAGLLGSGDAPLEARGALQYGQDVKVTVGGGGGVLDGVGSPSFRVFAGLAFTPVERDDDGDGIPDDLDACPSEREDRDGYLDEDGCPDPDNDRDGIPDDADRCPNRAEDKDGFQDEDGCPEDDNDQDGVPDGYDACEGEKEDLDGDRDDDGCPDYDRDRDGVDDSEDQCPDEPEDTDGLGDDDGCPEDDFDGDGILDADDACPEAAEQWNGILDEDGCPEDDGDDDSVPDQVDRCPDNPETLNGKNDGDGCPDGERIVVLNAQRLLPTNMPQLSPDSADVGRAQPLVNTIADYVKRNHQRGSVRVVVVAPADDALAAPRAANLAAQLERRLGTATAVSSGHVLGTPMRFEIELLPPGWSALPRPKPEKAPEKAESPAAKKAESPPVAPPPAPKADAKER